MLDPDPAPSRRRCSASSPSATSPRSPTLRADGSPHVVAVGFTFDDDAGLARVITFARPQGPQRGRRPRRRAAVCQVDGGRWLTLEGPADVTDDPAAVAEGVRRYAERYRQPGERDDRVVIEIAVDRVLGPRLVT